MAEPNVHATTEAPVQRAAAQAPPAASPAPRRSTPAHWQLRPGVGVRGLRLVFEDKDEQPTTAYQTNLATVASLELGYDGLRIAGSVTFGNYKPVRTHGRSDGFNLVGSLPLKVNERELVVEVVAQDYRGMFAGAGESASTPDELASEMRAHYYEVAASYHLNRKFSFANYTQYDHRPGRALTPSLRLAYANWGAKNPTAFVASEEASAYAAYAGLRAASATTLSAAGGVQAYGVNAKHLYLAGGALAGPGISNVRLTGASRNGWRSGTTLGLNVATGFRNDEFRTGVFLDARGQTLWLPPTDLMLVSLVAGLDAGYLF